MRDSDGQAKAAPCHDPGSSFVFAFEKTKNKSKNTIVRFKIDSGSDLSADSWRYRSPHRNKSGRLVPGPHHTPPADDAGKIREVGQRLMGTGVC